MSALSEKQDRFVDSILGRWTASLQARADGLASPTPSAAFVVEDMARRRAQSLRAALADTRVFGSDTRLVAEALTGDDDAAREQVLSAEGEASLAPEVCPWAPEANPDAAEPEDLSEYYELVAGGPADWLRLVDLWAWWDLPDAADEAAFDEVSRRFDLLRGSKPGAQVVAHYRGLLGKADDAEVTRKEILAHEAARAERIADRMDKRLERQAPWRMIWVPKETMDDEADSVIMDTASSLSAIEQIEADQNIDPQARSYYGDTMGRDKMELSVDDVLDFERANVVELKSRLAEALSGGLEYADLKAGRAKALRRRVDEMKQVADKAGD